MYTNVKNKVIINDKFKGSQLAINVLYALSKSISVKMHIITKAPSVYLLMNLSVLCYFEASHHGDRSKVLHALLVYADICIPSGKGWFV